MSYHDDYWKPYVVNKRWSIKGWLTNALNSLVAILLIAAGIPMMAQLPYFAWTCITFGTLSVIVTGISEPR